MKKIKEIFKAPKLLFRASVFSIFYYFFQLLFLVVLLSFSVGVVAGLASGSFLLDKNYDNFRDRSNPSLVYFDLKNTKYSKQDAKHPIFDGAEGFKDYLVLPPSKVDPKKATGIDSIVDHISTYFNKQLNQDLKTSNNQYFHIMFRDTRILEDQSISKTFKVVNYDSDHNNTDKILIEQGRGPQDNHEIMVSSIFAQRNNVNVGEYYVIFGQSYKVVGIANSWDFTYPLINNFNVVTDNTNNGIIYAYKTAFYQLDNSKFRQPQFITLSSTDREIYLIGGVDQKYRSANNFPEIEKDITTILKNFTASKVFNDSPLLQSWFDGYKKYDANNDSAGYYYYRTHLTTKAITYIQLFTIIFSVFILFITLFIFYNLYKRRFKLEKYNIKVFCFLGYSRQEIKNGYLSWTYIIFILSAFLIIFISVFCQWVLLRLFNNFFTIPIIVNFLPLLITFVIVFLIVFSFIVAFSNGFVGFEIAKILEPE
ncbi:FtsX-like permease family protein [Mycoplasma sp. SG1]|uniref:FtsX-like permease family protein n=1 Tax=Mycoplasma sp. SG1 TaxID=2810348 RepID=UPI002023C951|nr:FtsX-like permease family protein [Mycoplasma sp. SG1]URM52812.1 hypothetical protein JRW51_00500 [Mycoplasma sp. SG1]